MKKITVNTIKQVKKEDTKTVWQNAETTETIFNEKQYKNCTSDDTIKWFRNIGGSETVTRNYTKVGYVVTKIVSTSPDKQNRTIREFTFDYVDYNYLVSDLRKIGFEYDKIDTITDRLMKDSAIREKAILENYKAVSIEGNILSVIDSNNNSFNIDLRNETLGGLC